MARRLLLLLLLALTGCSTATPAPRADGQPLRVLATTGMIGDLAARIGGEHVAVDVLMGPGIDPHRFIPGYDDEVRMRRADLIFYNGLHLEGKMSDIFEEMATHSRTEAVAARIPVGELRPAEEGHEGVSDPHIWFDVKLWMRAADRIRDVLVEVDPAHSAAYAANADKLLAEMRTLDDEVRAAIATIPADRRVLVTSHDAFGYFGRAYGIEVIGLQGVSTAAELSPRETQQLADTIGKRGIPTIFTETSVPEKGLQAVRQAVKSRYGIDVRISPKKLYSDALGEPGSDAATWAGMVRANVRAIVEGLRP